MRQPRMLPFHFRWANTTEGIPMKRTANRLLLRLAMLCIAIILGAIAVSQAQKGLQEEVTAEAGSLPLSASVQTTPIPPRTFDNTDVYGEASGFQEAATAAPENSAYGGGYASDSLPAVTHGDQPASAGAWDDSGYGGAPAPPPAIHGSASSPPNPPSSALEDVESEGSMYGNEAYVAPAPAADRTTGYDTAGYDGARYESAGYGSEGDDPAVVEHSITDDGAASYNSAANDYADQTVDAQVQYVANEEPVPPMTLAPPISGSNGGSADEATYAELPPIDSLPVSSGDDEPSSADRFRDPAPPYAEANTPTFDADPGFDEEPSTSDPYANSVDTSAYTGAASIQVTRKDPPQPPLRVATNSFGTPTPTAPSDAAGNGKPGPAELEGPQTPTLTVAKAAPSEIQVGKPAKFQVTVRNTGPVDAHDVVIYDEIPHGTRLVQTVPTASLSPNGSVVWQMGTVRSGSEVSVAMEIIPLVEGDIGSVAKISFNASASARTTATKPKLLLEHTGPGQVLVGEDVVFHIKLSNPGSGIATNVRLEEDVPVGLRHVDGSELEYHVGTIRPGEARLLELTLKADQPGEVDNILFARADADLSVEDHCPVTVVAPALQLEANGPKRRYLDRKATVQIRVANPGTAPAEGVELVARLPKGLEFVSTNNAGQYNSADHAVYWSLAELPPQEMGTVEIVTNAVEMGDQRIRIESRAGMGLSDNADWQITVEGLAALLFTLTDVADPIEVDGQTTYEILVQNQGSKTATNLRIAALIPEGMQAINGEGPTRVVIDGQQVMFEPLPRLAAQADANYKIHVRGITPGDKRLRVQLISDEVSQPVTNEESTHVYSDE